MKKIRKLSPYVSLFTLLLTSQSIAFAQETEDTAAAVGPTITGEGISGDIDKKRRSPVVTIGVHNTSTGAKILVDAQVVDPEYQKYPIQFDFFVNRQFFTSQIRSTELPGGIGIDVPTSKATTPFNYTIIARTLHPNREFTTVINGAVFASDLNTTFDCTLTTGVNSDDSIEYIANDTTLSQTGNSAVSLNFETESTPEGHHVNAALSINIGESEADGTLILKVDEETEKTISLSGELQKTDGKVTSLTLNSSDSDVALSCS